MTGVQTCALPISAGHLEHPARLAAVFARLQAVETRAADADVRIIQLGDSHTASDYGTSVVRARLAGRFGDGGRGFFRISLVRDADTLARAATIIAARRAQMTF